MYKYLKIFSIIVPLSIAAVGCKKLDDFGDTNVNPGSTTSPIVGALLTNVQSGVAGFAAETRGGLYCQYFSETQYPEASLYAAPQFNFDGTYAGPLYDLQNIILQKTSVNQSAVAKILKSYIYWTITDKFGDIPYSQALIGNATPKYDTQEAVYKGLIADLTAAVSEFNTTSVITGDIIYKGDVASWKRLGNSLRLLMALRLSKKYPTSSDYAALQFKAALADAGGVIADNTQNFTVAYPGGNFRNPWFVTYEGRSDFAQSKFFTDLVGSLGDARQASFGTSTVGVPYGLIRVDAVAFTNANANWSRILKGDKTPENSPVVIVSAAQVFLARAEAADRGWTTENLTTTYEAGIKASFAQWGYTASTAYLTQSSVALSAAAGTAANLQTIATQRYLALYPNGLEGWSEWRRTGFPVLTPAPAATSVSKQIPRRFIYGTNEYGSNAVAVKAAAALIPGGDVQDSKVWWDR